VSTLTMTDLHTEPAETAGPLGPERPALPRRDFVALLVAAACLQAIVWAALLALFAAGRMGYGLHELADTLLYHFYASSFALGRWPYADVPVEYPALANLAFLLAPSGGSVAEYERWFSTAMLAAVAVAAVLTTAAAALAWRSLRRGLAVAVAYAVLTACCGALAVNRYDALVALTLAAALLFLAVRRPLPAGVSLGLGFALKLTPALLLPLVVLPQRSRRQILVTLAGFAVAAVVPFVPFVLNDPSSAAYPFTYHADRPLQLESVPGTPWATAALAGWAQPRIDRSFGSQNYAGDAPDAVAAASPWVLAAAVVAVYVAVWRRRSYLRAFPETVPVAALAVLLVAICASKVLSPQFLIWTLPVVALCVAQSRWLPRAAALAVALATALTQAEFPARYWDLVALQDAPLAILVARNVTLLVAAGLAVAALVTLPSADRTTSRS
jgi:hypothetical protein